MGVCSTKPKDAVNNQVGGELQEALKKSKTVKKLLLLGAGGSGKSTIFKQLQYIHGGGFAERDRKTFKSQIYEQILENMKLMLQKCEESKDEDVHYNLKPENLPIAFEVLETRSNEIDARMKEKLVTLWNDPAIEEIYGKRNEICIPDSTAYFFDEIERIAKDDYLPTDKDLLLVRYRTTGMTEKEFVIDGTVFKIVDVGGQRNERRKWIHFFDGVTAVIFVAALSSYDEVSFEDEEINNMIESLNVFSEHCNSHWFENTAFILFLNKKDVFEIKIQQTPLTVCFPDYDGANNYKEGLDYIKKVFDSKNKNPADRQIYTHVTCATDTDNIQKVFGDVQHIVINGSLATSGLI